MKQLLQYFPQLSLRPDNLPELRGLILQLAVTGKLTAEWRKENPNVEPASELLARIRAEKAELVKTKQIKQEKPLPAVDEEEVPFVVPEGWVWCRLGEIIKVSSGKNLPKRRMNSKGKIPVYGGNGLTGSHDKFNVDEKTIVIGRVGYYCGSIHLTEKKAWVTDNAFIVQYSEVNIFRSFLVLLLRATNLKENENATAQPVISGRKIYPIPLALPPLPEQKAIVQIVAALLQALDQLKQRTQARLRLKADYATAALRRLTTAPDSAAAWQALAPHFHTFFNEAGSVQALRAAILQLAVQGKLTAHWRKAHPNVEPASELLARIRAEKAELVKAKQIREEKPLPDVDEEEVPFVVPEGWVWCRLGEIIQFMAYGTSQKTNEDDSNVPVLRMGNITSDGELTFKNLKYIPPDHKDLPKLYLDYGDLVFNRTNSYELVGKCAVYEGKEESYTLASYLIKITPFVNLTNSRYLNFYINSSICRQTQIEPQVTAQTNQANFSGSKLKNIQLPLPPLPEQAAIVQTVEALLGLCTELEGAAGRREAVLGDWVGSVVRF